MADGAAEAPATANDGPGQEVVGKAVKKKFGVKNFSGTVENYDPEEKWYRVKYEDGDEEEVDWAELSQLIAAAEKQTPKKQKGTPAKAPAAKRSKVAAAPAAKQTVDGKRVAAGGPGQGRAAAKRVSVATPKAREAAAAAKKPVGRPRKGQAEVDVPEGGGRDAIGRKVRKKFEDIGAYYTGEVTGYDPQVAYYKVVYTDGDAEEMEWDELSTWLVPQEANGTAEAGPSGTQAPDSAATSSPAKATRKATAATAPKESGIILLE